MNDRLNPKSILVCNLALRECKGEVLNDAKSLMNHFVEKHDWKKIPQLVQKDILNQKPHPHTKEIMTVKTYLKLLDEDPQQWWWDNQFYWVDIRNLHFLHKTSKKLRSLRMYYHE